MKITLSVATSKATIRQYDLCDGQYLVGTANCDVVLSYPTVSRQHGRLTINGSTVTYSDLSSRNGSFTTKRDAHAEHADRRLIAPESSFDWLQASCIEIGPFKLSWKPASEVAGAGDELDTAEVRRHAMHYAQLLNERPTQARDLLYDSLEQHAWRDQIIERIHREFHGNGPLHEWLADPCCREILANSHDEIFVDVGEGLSRTQTEFLSRETFEAWATRTAVSAGRRLDLQHPICEATLPGGARFHAVMSPVSARGLSLAIRRFGSAPINEEHALSSGWIDKIALSLLKDAIRDKRNLVISGGTSTGKTSLLNFLCHYLPGEERIVTVEDTVELSPPVKNLVQLQARTANADGVGEVSLRRLVQCALRMRPDRIIVGECRGAEVLEMLQALNTGHPGSLTTIHANSAAEAIQRMELLALLGAPNLSIECIREWIRSSVEVIVQVERDSTGNRFISAIMTRAGTQNELKQTYVRNIE